MEPMKSAKRAISVLTALVVCLCLAVPALPAAAASKNAVQPGASVKSGRYIYYAYEMSGVRMGIMRYDTKTKKKKQISSYKNGKKSTNGFYSLNIKGNYIYAEWDKAYGSGVTLSYIYKINKKTGKKKKLAKGCDPVVIGKYIYYKQVKTVTYPEKMTKETGTICRMTLSGKNKTVVKSGLTKTSYGYTYSTLEGLYAYGGKLLYSLSTDSGTLYNLDGDVVSAGIDADYGSVSDVTSVSYGGYRYYIAQSGTYPNAKTTLYREKDGTTSAKAIASFPSIKSFRVHGNYIMLKTYSGTTSKFTVYCMKTNGKAKKKLASWTAAE